MLAASQSNGRRLLLSSNSIQLSVHLRTRSPRFSANRASFLRFQKEVSYQPHNRHEQQTVLSLSSPDHGRLPSTRRDRASIHQSRESHYRAEVFEL
jgi:hypothetical protein